MERALEGRMDSTRIIAFLTGVIVPAAILDALPSAAYNIHPGPPEYPGSYPESFAIWDGATAYGITAHEMAPKVDTGAILRVSRFDLPVQPDLNNMGDLVFGAAVEMFAAIAEHCAISDDDIPPSGDHWAAKRYTKQDFAALCRSGGSYAGADLDRLRRACGKDFIEN